MEATAVLIVGALLCAFAAAFCVSQGIVHGYERRKRYHAYRGLEGDAFRVQLLASALRNGVPLVRSIAYPLLGSDRIGRLVSEATYAAEERGLFVTPIGLLSTALAADAAILCLASLLSLSLVCGIAVAACAAIAVIARVNALGDKRRFALRQSVPEALNSMQVCFQAGFSLLQTFQQVAGEIEGPLSKLFAHSAHMLQTGATASETLSYLRTRASVPELAFVAVALDVQHQAGGSMRGVLDSARKMIEDELELSRKLRIQTAQAKLSARVVTIIPFVLVALFSLVSEDFLGSFFESVVGIAMLLLACGMQASGILIVRRMLKVKE